MATSSIFKQVVIKKKDVPRFVRALEEAERISKPIERPDITYATSEDIRRIFGEENGSI